MADVSYVVIGLNYGSEGKGAIVNYLGHKHSDDEILGIKLTGSINSSQTVQINDNTSHEFRHFSSATTVGARTYLGRSFMVDPAVFRREREDLISKGVVVRHVWVDPTCKVITPYDVLANQIDFFGSGKNIAREGTSGLGVYYAEYRNARRNFTADHILNSSKSDLVSYLRGIKTHYDENYWGFLTGKPKEFQDIWNSTTFMLNAIEDMLYFQEYASSCTEGDSKLYNAKTNIFEMPLGMSLGRYHGPGASCFFTDSAEVVNFTSRIRALKTQWKTIYVTRPYQLRIGEIGPFPHYPNFLDEHPQIANSLPKKNQFQDKIRLAPLQIPHLRSVLMGAHRITDDQCLAVTCLDQFQGVPIPYLNRKDTKMTEKKFLTSLSGHLSTPIKYKSYGVKREAMEEL